MQCAETGPQLSWRFVYLVEYLGPLLFHPLVLFLRGSIFPHIPVPQLAADASGPLSSSQQLLFGMLMLHFIKRELETAFVHKFSASTMPARNIVKNSAFYWLLAGLLSALDVYHPRSLAAREQAPVVNYLGLALYGFGEAMNAAVHWHLAGLRSAGGTERKIPRGWGFGLVTCPNYMFEVIAWVGMIVVSRSWAVTLFIAVGTAQMRVWAIGKERNYRKEFGEKYKNKKWVMLPGFF
jgi:very-long-chain enoyl-CoA reductase